MRYLTTINTNDYLRPNVRASHEHAAARWGCTYNVIIKPCGNRTDTFGIKLQTYLYPYEPEARVMYIDADAVIRSDCPCPIDMAQPDKLIAVECVQGDGAQLAREAIERSFARHAQVLDRISPARKPSDPYFNGGMMVFCPQWHTNNFRWADAHLSESVGGMDEQTVTNLAFMRHEVHFLPREFNYVGPEAIQASPHLPGYITHYAGKCANRKRELLEHARWRVA